MIKERNDDDNAFINIGLISKPHGVRGEVKILPLTDNPERYNLLKKVFICGKEIGIDSVKYSGKYVILKFTGYENIDDVKKIINNYVCISRRDAVVKNEGEFFYFELEGLKVQTETGEIIGVIEEILDMPANKVFSVKNAKGREILLPFVNSVVKKIDVENGFIEIELMKDLIT